MYTANTPVGAINFLVTGVYEVSCAIDGDTGLRCDGAQALDSTQLDGLFASYLAAIDPVIFDG